MTDLVQQVVPAVDLGRRIADVVQYVTASGVIGLIVLVFSLRDRVGSIETTLKRFHLVDERSESHSVTLGKHETRLDGHDDDITRIDASLAHLPSTSPSSRSRA